MNTVCVFSCSAVSDSITSWIVAASGSSVPGIFQARIHRRTVQKRSSHQDNHDDVIINLEPDILESEVKWALESIITNKASGGDGIPVELFQILKDDAVKVLHSICQQIWKTQQWPQDWTRSVFIPIQRKEMQKNVQTIAQLYSSHMLVK